MFQITSKNKNKTKNKSSQLFWLLSIMISITSSRIRLGITSSSLSLSRTKHALRTNKIGPSTFRVIHHASTRTEEGGGQQQHKHNKHVDKFQSLGILDEQGLTKFDTLHEMQVHSCMVYAKNELFGTFHPTSGTFQYMTYEDYGTQVHQCRSMLKNLGTSS